MKEIKAIVRENKLDEVLDELANHPELPGVTISFVQGFGRRAGRQESVGLHPGAYGSSRLAKLECVVDDEMVDEVLDLIGQKARTGMAGDGKITVSPVEQFLRIRTGERSGGER